MLHNEKCLDCLAAVVTVAEAAFMYQISTRRMAVWCEDSLVMSRRTEGGSYLISLDDLMMRKGEPKRWPSSLNMPERGE